MLDFALCIHDFDEIWSTPAFLDSKSLLSIKNYIENYIQSQILIFFDNFRETHFCESARLTFGKADLCEKSIDRHNACTNTILNISSLDNIVTSPNEYIVAEHFRFFAFSGNTFFVNSKSRFPSFRITLRA